MVFKFLNVNNWSSLKKSVQDVIEIPLENEVTRWTDEFNDLNRSTEISSEAFANFYAKVTNPTVSEYLKDIQAQGTGAQASVDGVYDSLVNSVKGFKGIKGAISAYNQASQISVTEQDNITSAVQRSDASLGNYLASLNGAKASMLGYAGSVVKATAKQALMALGTTALVSVVTTMVSTIVGKFSELTTAYEDSLEELDNYSSEISSLKDNVSSLTTELKESISKLHELEKIEKPSLFDQDDIAYLKEYNDLLEKQIKIAEYDLQNKIDEANKTSQKTYSNAQQQVDFLGINNLDEFEWWEHALNLITNGGYGRQRTNTQNLSNLFGGNTLIQQEQYVTDYENKLTEFQKFQEDYYTSIENGNPLMSADKYDKKVQEYTSSLSAYETELKNLQGNAQKILLGLDPSDNANADVINNLTEFVNNIETLLNDDYTNFTDLYNDTKFADVTTRLEELAKEGKLTSETFANITGVEDFQTAFEDMGYSVTDVINSIIDKVGGNGIKVSLGSSLEDLTTALTTLKETYDSTFSNQSTMQSAFDKIVKGTSLTSDEVLKLKELCPELTNEFSQTADGWIIDANKIKTANANLVQSTKDDIRKQIADYQAIIDEWDNISDYREKRSRYDEFAEAQQQIDELNLVLKMFSITLSDTDEQANVTLSDLKSAFDLLKDATDEFNTNGHLTVSTLKSIVSQYPDMQDAVDKFAGGLITEEQLLAELTTYYNQDLENYKTYLFDKFAATDSVTWGKYIQDNKDYIENFKEIYKIDLANCSTYADAKQKILDALVHIPDTTAYRETVKNILGNMQASYQQFYGDLNGFGSVEDILNTPDTSSKTSLPEEYQTALAKLEHEHNLELKSDKEYYIEKYQLAKDYLQGHDEYLSEWQSAEESCYKELKQLYQDAIDEQVSNYEDLFDVLKNINEEKIKALEDEKSALQDNADEQDRILKIQEAQLALDKAKKQTTWVLTEQGLKQVTDEKAVKEAQTTLDDALRESEIAELDKKIKALEDENSGYDQYKTDWENQQKKNNLVNVVGLSEDELQNITNENIKRIAEKYTDTLTAQSKLSSAETLGKTLNIDDLFKMFGSPYTADEAFAKLKEAGYSTFTNSSTDMNKLNQAVNSVTNNKNSNVGDINIVINDATDPQKVGEVVIEKLTNIYTYLNNKS